MISCFFFFFFEFITTVVIGCCPQIPTPHSSTNPSDFRQLGWIRHTPIATLKTKSGGISRTLSKVTSMQEISRVEDYAATLIAIHLCKKQAWWCM
jgi:hypothetical protein